MTSMTAATGRREANKQATRTALRAAAKQLFAEHGYEQTTVRDIAKVANVTERTFYRYFDGKEDLVSEEFRLWLSALRESIFDRPEDEPPLTAVHQALLSVVRQAAAAAAPGPMWLVSANPPGANLRRANTRPLLRLEEAIAAAIMARPRPERDDRDYEFRVQVIAKVSVAAVRSAVAELRTRLAGAPRNRSAEAVSADLERLIDQAFAIITNVATTS